jgi:hypothetical protein
MMNKQIGATLFAFMALGLTGLSCATAPATAPAPTPLPPAQAPVINIQPSPTLQKATQIANLDLITEEFDSDLVHWTYFVGRNNPNAQTDQAVPITLEGRLVLDIAKNLDLYTVYEPASYADVRVDARLENKGNGDHTVNLVCRLSERGWYEVSVKDSGLFWMFACDTGRGACITLADGGSKHFRPGNQTNELTLICEGRTLKLLVNGIPAGTFTDNRFLYEEGRIGVGLTSFSLPARVEFDWVKISTLGD